MDLAMAQRLVDRRKAAGFSQEALAAQLGVSRQAVSKWERSESSPDTDNLIALAALYGVSLDELLYGEAVDSTDDSQADDEARDSDAGAKASDRAEEAEASTEHADCGDNVIIINASKAVLTGNKMEQKYYRTHSGWVGGLKETKYRLLMQQKPELAMRVAVRGMMPRNIVTKDSLKRLHIYAGEQHDHAAQKPELVK